ncbi:MAG TPA: penicillin-binding protein 2 [Dehalococcoidia bacterium]|nr:penicillin-binding protein 2 [Dehalococcoidia bacterium]
MPNPYTTGRKPWRSEPWRSEYQEQNDEQRGARHKIFYFGLLVVVVFGILTIQLARLQLVNGEKYAHRAETNRLRQVPVLPARGLIYDRTGVPLVENRATFAAAVVAADLPEERETDITVALQEMLGVPAGQVSEVLQARRRSNDPFSPAVIKDNISEAQAFAIREKLAELPGVRVVVEPSRRYLDSALMAHVLGFVGRIDEEEYDRLATAGYQLTDYLGKTGVEYTYESVLRGTPGVRDVETDASGREIRVLGESPARSGANLILSIDVELQRKVEEYLRAAMGKSINAAAVVVDVRNGDILSLVSLPVYDNNIFTGRLDETAFEKLQHDPGKPMLNHVIAEQYPPGSTFKQITGLAALQEGVANASTRITSNGYIDIKNQYNPSIVDRFRDWSALGAMDFYRGVSMSSDVYFYYLSGGYAENGRDLFQGLGAARLADWSRRFGLGAKTGIDLPGESAGNIPDPAWKEKTFGEVWTLGDTYHFGIGQGFVTTTPLQMALVTAAIANGGDVLIPHVVKEVRDADGRVLPMQRQTVRRNLNVDPRNMTVMREGMRQAVANVDGTARGGAARSTSVAGKTGTAEFGERRPDGSYKEHGWFTGYAPVNNPEIAVAVFLEQGNGAGTAAPVASRIFEYYFSRQVAQGRTP